VLAPDGGVGVQTHKDDGKQIGDKMKLALAELYG